MKHLFGITTPRELVVFSLFALLGVSLAFFGGGSDTAGQAVLFVFSFPLIYFSYKLGARFSFVFIPFLIFIAFAFASLLWTPSLYYTGFGALLWFGYFSVFFALYRYADSDKKAFGIIHFLTLLAAVLSAVGLYFFFISESYFSLRLGSTFYWHNAFGGFLAMILPVVFLLYFFQKERWLMYGYGAAAAVLSAAFFFTHSRGSWLALFVVLPFLLFFFRRHLSFALFGKALLAAFAALLIVLPVHFIKSNEAAERAAVQKEETIEENAATARLHYFSGALDIWRAHPLVGGGFDTFPLFHREYQDDTRFYATDPHNYYLKVLSELGIVGLLLLLFLLGALVRSFLGRLREYFSGDENVERKALYAGLAAGAAAALIHIGMDVDWRFHLNPVVFFALAALLAALGRESGLAPRGLAPIFQKTALTAVLVSSLVLSASGVSVFFGDYNHKRAETAYRNGNLKDAEYFMTKGISLNPLHPLYGRILGSIHLSAGDAANAEEHYWKALALNGRDEESWYALGELAYRRGEAEQAERFLNRSVEISPRANFAPYILLAKAYEEAGRDDDIVALLSGVLELYPPELFSSLLWSHPDRDAVGRELASLSTMLGEAYLRAGDTARAEEHFEAARRYVEEDTAAQR